MKKITTLICMAVISAVQLFAVNPSGDECNANNFSPQIAEYMRQQEAFNNNTDISGIVEVLFTVTEDKKLKVLDVNSKNIHLENHALRSLEDKTIKADCIEEGQLYRINVNFIYVI